MSKESPNGLEQNEETKEIIIEHFRKLRIYLKEIDEIVENNNQFSLSPELIAQIQALLEKNDLQKTANYQVRTMITIAELFYKKRMMAETMSELEAAGEYAEQLADPDLINFIYELIDLIKSLI